MKPFLKAYCKKHLFGILLLFLNGAAFAQESKNFVVLSSWHNELSIKGVSGNTISLAYTSLPANQAGYNHNSLWLWPSSEVPWQYPPMKMQVLPDGYGQSGSYVLDEVSIKIHTPYIACYAVDSAAEQICACAHLSAESDSTTNEWFTLNLLTVTSNAITFNYTTLAGYLPSTYGNWFGIWKGRASPYNIFTPMAVGHPVDDSSCNGGSLNNLSIESNQTYTLIYFAGKEARQAAAMIVFTVK